ncbi:calcium-transporting ATPase 12, plasma membrane-type-like [Pistacia vera]|uniref:calcium-transporting ATPase 12, plasma membrane-type-like n=1 Tax=Pistacia vera TaxID=55513 RepID=UPI001263A6CC|nr:calcium-transporting ATPase 12, plasma membrane-type-like [Pistacia vera]
MDALFGAQDPAQGFFQLLLKFCNYYIIALLGLSAALSIAFGISMEGLSTGWYQGAIIILAIGILVIVSTFRAIWNEKLKLSEARKATEKRQMRIDVLRGGNLQQISISEVVYGDIVFLKRGYNVPGDGLFISGEFLKMDDGLATINELNPFLFYGAKVVKGHGRMLVTSVGKDTAWGETMINQVTQAPSKTLLPAQLHKVIATTETIGLFISNLIIVEVFLHFKHGKDKHDFGVPEIKGKPTSIEHIIEVIIGILTKPNGKPSILTTSLALLVLGMVEGVPSLVALAIAYWNKKALSDKSFAKDPLACLSMGSVTTICTDKAGGLKLSSQEVDMCFIGEEVIGEDSMIDADVLETFCNGIGIPVLGQQNPGNSPQDSILSWARLKMGLDIESLRESCTIINELHSGVKGSRVLVRKSKDQESHMCLYWKGPAKAILPLCSLYHDSKGTVKAMDDNKKFIFEQIVGNMQSKNLETLAFAYKKVGAPTFERNSITLIGMLVLKHICWNETKEATQAFRNAGINMILISEDNVEMVKDIGDKCGLVPNSDRLVLEGPEFRTFTDEERLDMVDKISIIANSQPSDKLLLVQCLKRKGHIVAMVGVKTNETPALKEAHLGIAMGPLSTENARESSEIIIQDGGFSSLVTIMRCGRCANDNIQRYIQLEVTTVVAGLLLNTIMVVVVGDNPITAIQLVWVNLIVSVLGGIPLLTEPPSEELMNRQSMRRTDPFITKTMWRNIITQVLFQAAILVTFQFKSKSVLRINKKVSETMIFNSFVLCQVFNIFNARQQKIKNIFKGILQNLWLWVAVCATLVVQAAFVEIAHISVSNAKLNGEHWGISLLMGMLTLPVDFAAKSASTFIMYWHTKLHSPHIGSTGTTHSELASNVDPFINLDSTTNP